MYYAPAFGNMPLLLLASTSPYRKQLLERLRIPFECQAPPIDEEQWKSQKLSPVDLATKLAIAKAESLAEQFPEHAIIGSDQVCCCDGILFSKPGTVSTAVDQLSRLAGKEHQLITSLAVWQRGITQTHVDVTRLTMRSLTQEEIERYVQSDHPLDCAGSYRLEELGISLFDSIESADHSAIIGLPLLALCRLLRECGFVLP